MCKFSKVTTVVKICIYLSSASRIKLVLVSHSLNFLLKGTNLKLKMENEIKSEVKCQISLAGDSTADVIQLNKIKKEFSLSGPYSQDDSVEHVVVKAEDTTSNKSLDLQIKSEVPDEKYSNNIKLEQLVSDELDIKNEVEESLVDQTADQTTKKSNQFKHICNSKFDLKNNLQQHLDNHSKMKRFQCNICDCKCIRKSTLKQHIKIHTGEKPFQCNMCDYKCIRKSSLQRHIKTHTGEKPFQCYICDYKCTEKSKLQQHVKKHTGEKPFQCKVCDYKCIQRGTLKRHSKKHAGEKLFNVIYVITQPHTIKNHK